MTDLEVMPEDESENDSDVRMQAVFAAAWRVVEDIRVSERTGKPRFPGYLDQLETLLGEYEAHQW